MPAYRLMFNTSNPRIDNMADALIEADYVLGSVVSAFEDNLLSHNHLTSAHGVTQYMLRFAAADDAHATRMAEQAVSDAAHTAPVDAISLARRSRSYVPVAV